MEFVQSVVENFTSGGGRREEVVEERTDYYSSGPGGPGGPPPVPRPWVARWAEQERAWFYINEETGERRWEVPYGGGASGGGYYEESQRGYAQNTYVQQDTTYVQEEPRKDHSLAYGAAGVAAGVLGGAVLTYEGEKIHNAWDREEDRIEDFPENAAQWTGEKVGEVEYGAEKIKDDVEDFPENAAEWVGDKVGSVERFGDEVDYAYDEGKAEGRAGW